MRLKPRQPWENCDFSLFRGGVLAAHRLLSFGYSDPLQLWAHLGLKSWGSPVLNPGHFHSFSEVQCPPWSGLWYFGLSGYLQSTFRPVQAYLFAIGRYPKPRQMPQVPLIFLHPLGRHCWPADGRRLEQTSWQIWLGSPKLSQVGNWCRGQSSSSCIWPLPWVLFLSSFSSEAL